MLLTTSEYRLLHSTALEDDPLQGLLDAAEAEILDYASPGVEWLAGGRQLLALSRSALSITSVVEVTSSGVETTFSADDYELHPEGFLLYRVGTGTNPAWKWHGRNIVTYVPRDMDALQRAVQADLVFLAETYAPNLSSTTVGSWTEQYRQAQDANVTEHDSILSRLVTHGRMAVVGG